jgi:hypothetical protein
MLPVFSSGNFSYIIVVALIPFSRLEKPLWKSSGMQLYLSETPLTPGFLSVDLSLSPQNPAPLLPVLKPRSTTEILVANKVSGTLDVPIYFSAV